MVCTDLRGDDLVYLRDCNNPCEEKEHRRERRTVADQVVLRRGVQAAIGEQLAVECPWAAVPQLGAKLLKELRDGCREDE